MLVIVISVRVEGITLLPLCLVPRPSIQEKLSNLMQIFMQNLPYGIKQLDVELALIPLLHRPPITTDESRPINFHVRMFSSRAQNGRRPTPLGRLTLPSDEIGQMVLRLLSNSLYVRGRQIRLTKERGQPDEGLIAQVREGEWKDPKPIEEERIRRVSNSKATPLDGLAFGRLCRDGVFSIEYQAKDAELSVECDQEQRRLCLIHRQFDIRRLQYVIARAWFRASQLLTVVKSTGYHIFVETTSPPVFERAVQYVLELDDREQPAERLESLFPGIDMPSAINRFIRLSFNNNSDYETFTARCSFIHNHRQQFAEIRTVNRELYSINKKAEFQAFLLSVEYAVAFGLHKAVANGILDYQEVLDMKESVHKVVREQPEDTDAIFRTFTQSLEGALPTLLRLDDLKRGTFAIKPVQKSRRRNKRRKGKKTRPAPNEEVSAPTLSHILEQIAAAYNPEQHIRHKRLKFRETQAVYQSYRYTITPTSHVLDGPLPDQSNSLLREYGNHDCFLRVTFQGENRAILRGDHPRIVIKELLETRYKNALKFGVNVAGRQFTFLGYSMSALKEHSVVFVNEIGLGKTAEQIRQSFGDFEKISHFPALLGARWSQHFSASDPSVVLQAEEIRFDMPDIISVSKSVFTDGCSTMSTDLRNAAWKELNRQGRASKSIKKPNTFQIRFAGAKGVVSVDPRLKGKLLCLRDSQTKFVNQTARTLNILSTSARPIRTFLNRTLIMLLEHLGTDQKTFVRLQRNAIEDIERVKTSFLDASKLFQQHGLGISFRLPSLFNNMVRQLKINEFAVPNLDCRIIERCLDFAITHVLREIKFRAHLPVPGSYTLIGIADEWDCLEEGEIYATVSDGSSVRHPDGIYEEITGKVLITRSPQIHPGDVQFVRAVRRPQLKHLVNVVVFSCRGNRSLPSCLGGGDLDGDIYNLIVDPSLFPKRTATPGSYVGLPRKRTPNPSTVDDVMDFVLGYLQTDLVGVISILHLRIADQQKPDSPDCIKLAEKASHAVDFPKTGTPVDFSDLPKAPSALRPDFLAQEITEPNELSEHFYKSDNILGHLYRSVPLSTTPVRDGRQSFGEEIPQAVHALNRTCLWLDLPSLWDSTDELLDEMDEVLDAYIEELKTIANAHTMSRRPGEHLTEAELVVGSIQSSWADHRKRREAVIAMNIQTQELVQAIRDEFRRDDHEHDDLQTSTADGESRADNEYYDEDENVLSEKDFQAFKRAAAGWVVAQERLESNNFAFGPSSFGLLALGEILTVVKKAQSSS